MRYVGGSRNGRCANTKFSRLGRGAGARMAQASGNSRKLEAGSGRPPRGSAAAAHALAGTGTGASLCSGSSELARSAHCEIFGGGVFASRAAAFALGWAVPGVRAGGGAVAVGATAA
eukprot:EG_transcript_41809